MVLLEIDRSAHALPREHFGWVGDCPGLTKYAHVNLSNAAIKHELSRRAQFTSIENMNRLHRSELMD